MLKHEVMRVELTPSAKDHLTNFCKKNGMTQVAVMSRIAEWFANQSELIQAVCLKRFPKEIEADVLRLIRGKL